MARIPSGAGIWGSNDLTKDLVVTEVRSDAKETAIALVENNVPDRDFTRVVRVSRQAKQHAMTRAAVARIDRVIREVLLGQRELGGVVDAITVPIDCATFAARQWQAARRVFSSLAIVDVVRLQGPRSTVRRESFGPMLGEQATRHAAMAQARATFRYACRTARP